MKVRAKETRYGDANGHSDSVVRESATFLAFRRLEITDKVVSFGKSSIRKDPLSLGSIVNNVAQPGTHPSPADATFTTSLSFFATPGMRLSKSATAVQQTW
jgi:hypothetical protein